MTSPSPLPARDSSFTARRNKTNQCEKWSNKA